MLQRYDQEPHWLSDDHSLELPDDIGFEKEGIERFDLFTHKNFDLPRFHKSEQIKQLALSEYMFLLITRQNNIYRWRPEIESECQQLELPDMQQTGIGQRLLGGVLQNKKSNKDILLDKIFLNGQHAIICSDSGDNFYINYKDSKIRLLEQLRGKIVKAIAWSENSDENDTNEILIATKDSKIYLYRIDLRSNDFRESECKLCVTIPNERQINQIEQFTIIFDKDKYACVVASTNFSVFFFFGAHSLDILFGKYRDPQSVMRAESPPDRSHTSLLHLSYTRSLKPKATSFLYTNGRQLSLYQLPDKDLNESILTSAKQLKVSTTQYDMPIQIGLTEFHYFLLYADSIVIYSRITQQEVQRYELRSMGRIMGMQYERASEAFWIYSEKHVCKVEVSNEDKDAWKLLIDQSMYMEAYEICRKYDSPYTQYIAGLCGDQLFSKRQYSEAAIYYQRSSQHFEEIFLKYLNCDDIQARIGLEKYLKNLLENLKGESQRTIILSWLTELYVYRLNETDKLTLQTKQYENETQRDRDQKEKKKRQKDLNEDFEKFLNQYQVELPQELAYQVMISHGRLQNCVEYAKLNNNFEMIIQHHINEENYKEAIKNLKSVKDKSSLEVIQKYSYILMKHEPEAALSILISHIKKFDSTKIIGGLMNIPIEKRTYGIQFLEHSIHSLGCTEKSINNILIFFLTQPPQKDKLNEYLRAQEELLIEKEKINFDLDFALRLFKQASLIDAQIIIYGMMGLYTESVTLALDYGMIDTAKDYASRPFDDDKKKKLWMMIAERLLQQNQSIDKVIELTKQADLIKIEDLLPHFNENIKIEHFKDEICNSLRKYNEEIEKLKEEMKKLSQNSDQLKNELKMTKNKFLIIDTQQKCEHCGKHLFNDTFYIFPCNHGFHKECIVSKLKQLPQHSNKIGQIETYDMTMQSILMKSNPQQQKQKQQDGQSFFQLMNIFGNQKQEIRQQSTLTQEEQKLLKETKEKFDLLVASECIYCGPSVVDSIQIGFELDSDEKLSWAL